MTRSAMIIVFAAACASGSPAWGQAPVCSGERIPLDTSIGETPVMTLTLDGHTGGFLLDTGATYSAVDSETFGLPAGGSATLSGFSLPIATGGRFVAEDMGGYRGPAGGQRGRIGTDFLSLGVIEFHYEARPASPLSGPRSAIRPRCGTRASLKSDCMATTPRRTDRNPAARLCRSSVCKSAPSFSRCRWTRALTMNSSRGSFKQTAH